MDIGCNDILILKKTHPCGEKRWLVISGGVELRLRCMGCGHEILLPAAKAAKNIRTHYPSTQNHGS